MNNIDKPDLPKDWTRDSQRQIAIDFDGVIHDPYDGPRNGECYGPPLHGAKAGLAEIAERYEIIIFTCKGRANGPTYEGGKTGTDLVWDWLRKHNMAQYVKEVTATKPNGIAYIDDKSVRHTDWTATMSQLTDLSIL